MVAIDDIDTLEHDLGITARDNVRADNTGTNNILSYNSTVDAKDWIHLGRVFDKGQNKFPVPYIVIETVDYTEENVTTGGKKEAFIPIIYHAWIDQAVNNPIDLIEIKDRLKKLARDMQNNTGIMKVKVTAAGIVPEDEGTRVLQHVTVRSNVFWRQ